MVLFTDFFGNLSGFINNAQNPYKYKFNKFILICKILIYDPTSPRYVVLLKLVDGKFWVQSQSQPSV